MSDGQTESLTFGSLFAGIGGLDLGLERAGMECRWQVEIDDYATRVLERHWPGVRRWRDITTFPPDTDGIDGRNIREDFADGARRKSASKPIQGRSTWFSESWHVDLICGGFPCQDISIAGKQQGLSGARSGLFFEAVRVVRQLQPRYVVLENVAGLLSNGLPEVLGTLAQIGYDAEWHCVPAAAVGAPHIRDRVFIIASADADSQRSQGTIIRSFPGRSEWWDVEPDVGRVANGVPRRVDRLRGLGNAVVPQVAEFIGREIVDYDRRTNRGQTADDLDAADL